MRYNTQVGREAILNRRCSRIVSMSLSTLYDNSVTQHSGLTLLERTPKPINQSSKNLKPIEKTQKFQVECSNTNVVPAKLLHPNSIHSLQDNKSIGKLRLEGPSGGLQSKAQGFVYLGPENLHRWTAQSSQTTWAYACLSTWWKSSFLCPVWTSLLSSYACCLPSSCHALLWRAWLHQLPPHRCWGAVVESPQSHPFSMLKKPNSLTRQVLQPLCHLGSPLLNMLQFVHVWILDLWIHSTNYVKLPHQKVIPKTHQKSFDSRVPPCCPSRSWQTPARTRVCGAETCMSCLKTMSPTSFHRLSGL